MYLPFYFCLGDFEIFFATVSVTILGFIVYNVINCFSFRELLKRFGFLKISRRDFYECGFKPVNQKTIRLPIQFLLICVFFLLYDIELIFLFPFVSGITFVGFYDSLMIFLFFSVLLLSLIFDFNRHALV
jgi:NADH:ubiquinone oxidoreductase subunit 3 (subunit A)